MTQFRGAIRLPRRLAALALSGAALALLVAAAPAKPAPKPAPGSAPASAARPWSATVTVSSIGAHLVGNPAAKVRLVEYFSYTCSHCAEFAADGDTPLKTQYVDKGTVLFEYRNFVRDPVDMTAALLARCGGPKAFAANHHAIFMAQPVWLKKVEQATAAQQAAWSQGSTGDQARRIAADTGLDALMRARGYSAAQLDACVDSEVAQAEILAMTNIGRGADRVRGTPTFFVNGRQAGVTSWAALKSQLDAAAKGS